MLGSLLAAALLVGGAAPAERTPDGPATLISAWTAPADQADGSVLTSLTVKVGAGGRAGVVRPLVGGVAGDPVDLPATPGTYTFPRSPRALGGTARARAGDRRARDHDPRGVPADDRAFARSLRDQVGGHPAHRPGHHERPRRPARDLLQHRARRRRRPARRSHRGPHRPARQRGAGARARRAAAGRRDADQRRRRPGRPAGVRRLLAGGCALRGRLHHRVPGVRDDAAGGRRVALVRDPRRGPVRDRRDDQRALGGDGPGAGRQLDRRRVPRGTAVRPRRGRPAAAEPRRARAGARCRRGPGSPDRAFPGARAHDRARPHGDPDALRRPHGDAPRDRREAAFAAPARAAEGRDRRRRGDARPRSCVRSGGTRGRRSRSPAPRARPRRRGRRARRRPASRAGAPRRRRPRSM